MAASSVWSWMWKEELVSPLLTSEQEEWCNASDNVEEVTIDHESKASRAETASKLLQHLDQWIKEEEPLAPWLEEKMDIPMFDDLPPPPIPLSSQDMVVPLKPSAPLVPSDISSRFTNLDVVSPKASTYFNNSKLPSGKISQKKMPSVPVSSSDMITYKPNLDAVIFKSPQKNPSLNNRIEVVAMKPLQTQAISLNAQYVVPSASVVPLEQTPIMIEELGYSYNLHETLTPPESPKESEMEEMQMLTMLQEMEADELDELVRMRVESLVDYPEVSVESSRSSLTEENESVLSPSSDSGSSDAEWTMAASYEIKTPKKRRMSKPYLRAPEDRRERKKEQNKNAATRYRLKKKQEVEEILSEEKHLQQTHEDLKNELTEVQREIKYLKNLMRDMFKAKGINN